MNIQDKVKMYKKHYWKGSTYERNRIEEKVRDEIDASPDHAMLWAELIFPGTVEFTTFRERDAHETAMKKKIICYRVVETGIIRC